MTYAYVTISNIKPVRAVLPGAYIGRHEIPVAKHSGYAPWGHGKRRTLAIIREIGSNSAYIRAAALAVAHLRGWLDKADLEIGSFGD